MTTNNLGIIFNIWPVFGFYMQVILFFLKGAKKSVKLKTKPTLGYFNYVVLSVKVVGP